MMQESQTNILRKFGIELVGAVPWGTHLCQFYESKEDLIDILVPYFSEGLRSNEFCMWVTSPPLEMEEARTALRKAVPDLEEYVRKGQIEIISYDDWYLLGGKFDANRVLHGWVEKENAALKRGFEGLRLTGNTFWIERDLWKSFVDYEEAVNAVIGEHRMIAVCTYCLTKCTGTDVLDVVRNHVGTLIRKEKDWHLVEDMAHRKETEEALVESESRYRSLFANMNSGFAYHKIIQDEDGKPVDYVFLEVNDDFAKLTGLKREDILGKRVTEVLPGIEKDPADWIGIYGKVALTGEPVRFENYSQNLKKWYSVSAYSPAKGYFAAAFDDITDRKQAEFALRESEQRWATTLASIGDAVIATDLDGKVTFMNAVAEELTDWTLKEASQKPITEVFNIINEQTRLQVEDPVARVLEEGVVVGLANHTILVRKDGAEVPIDDSGAPIKDEDGKVVGVVLVFRDITERKRTEKELRETRDYLENLLNYANAPIIVWDPEFRITKFNHAFERLTGLSSDEAIGKNLDILFPLDKKEESMAHIKCTLEGEYWEAVEILIQHADGTVKTLLWNSANIYDSSGKKIVATIAQGHDITERKKAEAILREQSVVISSASDAIFSTDNSFVIKSWNKAAERIFGWTAEEVIGKVSTSIFNAVYPTLDGTTREQAIEQLMNSGFWKGEIIYHKKDGSPIPVSVSSSRVKGENGSATGVVAVVHDITARKRREEALKETQRDLNRAQAVAKTGSWRLDMRRNLLLWSDETYRMFGIPKGTPLTYETFLGTVHPEDRANVDQRWQAALRGELYDIEHRIIVNGEIKWVREKAELEFDNNGVLQGGFGTVQEITEFVNMREKLEEYSSQMEQLANERAEKLKDAERLAAIGATAGMVGHDIRNPLQAIVGDLYLAKSDLASMPEGEEKEGMKESLREIEANIDYIDKIVQDLQDYARPLKPTLQETDFEELCKEVLLKDGIPENIAFSYHVKKEAKKVISDPTLLKRILSNLKNNAVQAMLGGGKLKIHAYQDADEVIITVQDTGVGIPEEVKPQLFTPLFTTKSKGQGFGLAVVKRMTEALKGTVTFESKKGKGTKFIIRLPQKRRKRGIDPQTTETF
jgi:PAS domain S-box-containing protein